MFELLISLQHRSKLKVLAIQCFGRSPQSPHIFFFAQPSKTRFFNSNRGLQPNIVLKNPERFSFGDRFTEIAKGEIFSDSTIIILYAPTQKPLIQGINRKIFRLNLKS
ncbi:MULTISPECIES: hypothetical protein [unclassified Microcoleus]|uniref:hypothetical protein n=1 Tax=unclassified Microcoleus TaxID=2642155 RepID=UPI0025CC161E|nr:MULTISPECIES: hypothetical protein [unclassified Microcoleus]